MSKCKKCGGSGDMFVVTKGEGAMAHVTCIPFRDIKAHEKNGFKLNGQTACCSVCNGLGVEDA